MILAADIELNTYGTIRMVKEVTSFSTGYEPQATEYLPGTISDTGGFYESTRYFFEILNLDFEEENPEALQAWSKISENQELLGQIFETLGREGIGFNPNPPANVTQQSMTWFYPTQRTFLPTLSSNLQLTNDRSFSAEAVAFLQSYVPANDFQDSQKVATLMTFSKHLCVHDWEGEPESWICTICQSHSYLGELP